MSENQKTVRKTAMLPDGRSIEVDAPVSRVVDPRTGVESDVVFPEHVFYAGINADIKENGNHYAKCANCGTVYQLTPEWSEGTVCSTSCGREFSNDIMGGL